MQANIQLKNSNQGESGWSYSLHKHDAGAHNCSSVWSQNGLGSGGWQPVSGADQGGLQSYPTASILHCASKTLGLLQEDPSHTYWGKGITIWSTRSFKGTGKPTCWHVFATRCLATLMEDPRSCSRPRGLDPGCHLEDTCRLVAGLDWFRDLNLSARIMSLPIYLAETRRAWSCWHEGAGMNVDSSRAQAVTMGLGAGRGQLAGSEISRGRK